MTGKPPYWIGKRPSDGKRWAYTNSAMILAGDEITDAVFHLYRRYVKQWNDIELDEERSLSEHTHKVHGAQVVGANRRWILHWEKAEGDWILEVHFARGFRKYYPGMSCGLNALRSTKDIRSIRLHWSGTGRDEFDRWLAAERTANINNGEWDEYSA